MDEVLVRFPQLGEKTFKKLLNKNLVKCMIVSKTWYNFITNEKFYKLQVQYENGQKNLDEFGNTPLHKAAEGGYLSKCKLIIDNVENKNPTNNFGETPLHRAAKGGYLDICRIIFKEIKDKNPASNNGLTPLHNAVLCGRLDICKLIIEKTMDKNPADKYGSTPLYIAAEMHCKYFCCIIYDFLL